MQTALDYLAGHWLAFGFIGAALVAFLLVFLKRRRLGRWFRIAALACAGLALPGPAPSRWHGSRPPRPSLSAGVCGCLLSARRCCSSWWCCCS